MPSSKETRISINIIPELEEVSVLEELKALLERPEAVLRPLHGVVEVRDAPPAAHPLQLLEPLALPRDLELLPHLGVLPGHMSPEVGVRGRRHAQQLVAAAQAVELNLGVDLAI